MSVINLENFLLQENLFTFHLKKWIKGKIHFLENNNMVQKNMPYINKSGYSMFWNSMWDSKNNYSKFLQKDFFIKSFCNFFFSDFLQNQFIFKFNLNKINLINIKNNYNLNFLEKNKTYINLYLNNNFNSDIYNSKIWLFKYQNWIIVYFFIFSKLNSYIFKKNAKLNKNNLYLYNYINNYYLNVMQLNFNKKYSHSFIFNKNNF